VAMVLVDPAERSRGVGRALLTRGLSLLDDVETVRLDATPAGEPLYRTLGFIEEARFSRLQLAPGAARMAIAPDPISAKIVTVRPLAPADWDDIAAYDTRVFGAERRAMLEWLWAGAPEYAWVARDGERLVGYVLGRSGHLFEHLGACLPSRADRAFVVDAPLDQVEWRRFLAATGFVEQRPFFRMSRGRPAPPGLPINLFATIGPEFG
jgi:ribosomal protein S18 acetylase RimI-like enzyme